MACIIKIPSESRGIISFTSQEREKTIIGNAELQGFLRNSKKDWIYLLHHNWQPCRHDDFFDASLCNHSDLLGGGECLNMDCCNFSPEIFSPISTNKYIDVLYVTRVVSFKRLQTFYRICKELLKQKSDIKIMLICSIPEIDCYPENPKEIYLKMFSREERRKFIALFFDYDYPFTVDKYYLSHLYNSSKVFLHTANEEYHSRVCSYALSCGVPVVGYKKLVSFVGDDLLKEPFFYEIKTESSYVSQVLKAIDNHKNFDYDAIKGRVSENFSFPTFKNKIKKYYEKNNLHFEDDQFFFKNLDYRLGRHCQISLGDNSLKISIKDLMNNCRSAIGAVPESTEDLEQEIIKINESKN